MTSVSTVDRERAKQAAIRYRELGYNALPSSGKRPLMRRFTRARDEGLSEKAIEKFWASNIQVATGVRWGLGVIDLDGPASLDAWAAWTLHRDHPPTWAVAHDPARGLHLWYRLPASVESLPFDTKLWTLDGEKHTAIQLLGDRNLIVAPPSIHQSGRRYQWLPGRSPDDLPLAELPAWVLDRVHAIHPRRVLASTASGALPGPSRCIARSCNVSKPSGDSPAGWTHDWRKVLDAIRDKVELARGWGLRVCSAAPNLAGWLRCRAVGREDRNPSAMFSALTGRYWEPPLGRCPMSLFDLAVWLGIYPDFPSAVTSLGTQYGAA